jgi:hypothetical protein
MLGVRPGIAEQRGRCAVFERLQRESTLWRHESGPPSASSNCANAVRWANASLIGSGIGPAFPTCILIFSSITFVGQNCHVRLCLRQAVGIYQGCSTCLEEKAERMFTGACDLRWRRGVPLLVCAQIFCGGSGCF